eukprot:1391884-Amorphochlora_amoeboformis.AAC.1
MHKQYDSLSSSSYRPMPGRIQVKFGTGKIRGLMARDTIRLGNGVEIKNRNVRNVCVYLQAIPSLTTNRKLKIGSLANPTLNAYFSPNLTHQITLT